MTGRILKSLVRPSIVCGLAICVALIPAESTTAQALGPRTIDGSATGGEADGWIAPQADSPRLLEANSPKPMQADGSDVDAAAEPAQTFSNSTGARQVPSHPASDTSHSRVALRWIVPDAVNLGQETDFRLVITNTATDAADAVVVQVKLPDNARLGTCDPPPATTGQPGSDEPLLWHLGPMPPGGSKTVHVALTPTSTGKLSPTAAVAVTRIAEASAAILEPRLELSIVGPAHGVIGQRTTYGLNVSNRGTGSAANVSVLAETTSGLSADAGSQLQYRIGTLAAGETRRIELPIRGTEEGNHKIAAAVQMGGEIAARGSHLVQIVQPALAVSIEGPKMRFLDRKATYVINIENPSPMPIHNVQVFHQVPEGFRFFEATDGGSFDSSVRQVAWFVGRLEPNSTATVAARLVPRSIGDHTIAAAVRADTAVDGQAETATRVEGVPSVVIEVADRDDPVEVQAETVYTIRVSNQGSKQAAGVQVAAVLPAQMRVVSVDGPTTGVAEGDQVVFEPLETLAPGQSHEYQVHVLCGQPGRTRFRAYLRTADIEEPVIEEELTRVYAD